MKQIFRVVQKIFLIILQQKTQSATAVLAMRQACKNILYTVANSGYYADGNPATGMTNMTKLFVMIDVILAVVLIVVDTIVIVRWRKKKKQAVNE